MMDYLGDSLAEDTRIDVIVSKPAASRFISGSDRRRVLISAAEAVFLAKGYVDTTMADIAAKAGMSKKTMYQVFVSKAELFDALLLERLLALPTLAETSDAAVPEMLRSMLMDLGRALLDPRQITLTRLLIANIASVPQANAIVTRRSLDIKTAISQWLGIQVERGLFQIPDLILATETLFGLAFASLQTELLLSLRDTPTEEELARNVDWTVGIFMREFAR